MAQQMEAVDKSHHSLLQGILNTLHYPVARAAAHYYPNLEDEVARFLRLIIRNCKPDWVVADVGCGHASFVVSSREFCHQLIGVDFSPGIAQNPWVGDKVRGDLYRLPLADGSIDLVISRYVLEHLEHPIEALREAARVLRPGGKLLVLTPNRRHYVCLVARLTPHWFHRLFLAYHGRFGEDVSPTRYRVNTPPLLREAARQAGFRVAELELVEGAPAYLGWSWPAFMLGVAYERLVNRFAWLAGLKVSMLAALEKKS